ncbi:alpha/beta fold hydrolase [Staphylococcus edaphicus]|uniref:Hydrolase n=1 Tax=Staphylococcus edaphicus TaxID=1955013 RepID=A0A2C6WPP1_9STAP|nr:alpha/beta hydrolase [Staphylococcus edaphicus]PHK50103.1 hydrolase [Staphylococcus edaphicus]UQW81597.1 alpha/beta hydrolase [Staphylococcus edaphicus]
MTRFTLPSENNYISVGDIDFAYKKFGKKEGIPLVFLIHFRGTMENWDPAMLEHIVGERPVILFDNTGVGYTNGVTPTTIEEMSENEFQFITALGYEQVDLLGFSIGGMVAQMLTIQHPELIRKLIVSGTSAAGGISPTHPALQDAMYREDGNQEDVINTFLFLFYPNTENGKALGIASLKRILNQKTIESTLQVRDAQLAAIEKWSSSDHEHALNQLNQLQQSTLVINGDNDIMVPTENSIILSENILDAQLIIYPEAGHGHLHQHPKRFAQHVNLFLNE